MKLNQDQAGEFYKEHRGKWIKVHCYVIGHSVLIVNYISDFYDLYAIA